MSATVQSVSTQAFSGTNSVTVTKPTGLAVNDLMIAHIVARGTDGIVSTPNNTPSGWTSFSGGAPYATSSGVGARVEVFSKVADSSDVAASNFTFDRPAGNSASMGGAIWRISGQSASPLAVFNADAEQGSGLHSSPSTFNATVTPARASSLILFLVGGSSGASAYGGYSVATSDPTWTERYDFGSMAGASAVRPETTATGNATVTYTGNAVSTAQVIVVDAPANFSPKVIIM